MRPEDWVPQGIDTLEKRAEEVVRSSKNRIVVAGPGAGKTELLAQRACYLLQTNLCPSPSRILAISFKRDAARNLKDRVTKRCGPDLGARFDSYTYDAFAKSLLDRFRRGLPEDYRPTHNYRLDFDSITERRFEDLLLSIPAPYITVPGHHIRSMPIKAFYKDYFLGTSLATNPKKPESEGEELFLGAWAYLLHGEDRSLLNFPMISRLSELLLRSNSVVLKALRLTYKFVFLDEYQDTTSVQHDLTKAAFQGSPSVLTAVGDNKQRIMGWAGALEDAFADFCTDFGAQPVRLKHNHRSAPRLVEILRHLTAAVDPEAPAPIAVGTGNEGDGECRVLLFPNHEVEAAAVAKMVAGWVHDDDIDERDICILTRNRPEDYTAELRAALQQYSVDSRVENRLQDLLAEPLVTLSLGVIRLALGDRNPAARSEVLDFLNQGSTSDDDHYQAVVGFERACAALRKQLDSNRASKSGAKAVLKSVWTLLGLRRLRATYPQYRDKSYLRDTCTAVVEHVSKYLKEHSWEETIDLVEGVGVVPIMTMHKSKGLEYHTIVFIGLEDSALWGFDKNPQEETAGFFVAFSRARKRVLFTFSARRPGKYTDKQSRDKIGRLYNVLEEAGVHAESVDD